METAVCPVRRQPHIRTLAGSVRGHKILDLSPTVAAAPYKTIAERRILRACLSSAESGVSYNIVQ